MRELDIPEVMHVDLRSFPVPWTKDVYETEIRNRFAHYYVARELTTSAIVGYGGLWIINEDAHVTTLAVDPNWRRMYVAERILIKLLQKCLNTRAPVAALDVREGNKRAQALYARYGFRETNRRIGYYTDNGEDAIVLTADLTDIPAVTKYLDERLSAISAAKGLP